MGRKSNKILSTFAIILLFFFSCRKNEQDKPVAPPANITNKTFVVCEGSYGNGNSALGMYAIDKDSFYEDIFSAVNGGQLGDVFQSMQAIGDFYFLCINNSDKVLVLGKSDYHLVATISIPKPRYILPVSSTKAYVSTLFSNKLYILDLQTLQVTGSIILPNENPEGMLLWQDKAIICTWDTSANKIYYINTATDAIEKEVEIAGRAPHSCVIDKESKLWVASGNVYKGKPAYLTRLEPSTGAVITSFSFPSNADIIKPAMNPAKDSLYFIAVDYNGNTDNNGIYRMNVAAAERPAAPFLAAKKFQYFWGLGIDPETGYIFIGDPKGFVQKGSVYIYRSDRTLLKEFKTGVGPGHFYFD